MARKFALAAFALFLPAMAQAQVKLLRHPSYSKGRIAFSYLGDIWAANENGSGVERLTDNRGRDQFPRFSPDGQWLAFSSDRAGNYDIYVMPAAGGNPRRLTFHSANDNVVGWSADSKRIVFSSARGNGAFPTVATLWEVPAEGGIEQPVPTDWGVWASYSPDGSRLAFTRHPAVWSRKHYRGSYAADLWLMDAASRKYTKVIDDDYKGDRLWPMYGHNGEIYFVSNEVANEKTVKYGGPEVMKSVNNIWKISEKGGKAVQVTHHTDGNLFFPSISADGKVIVYEDNFGLWKLDTATGKSAEIRIDVKADAKENDSEIVTIANRAESFHLSPSNRRAAIAVHGEIFTVATDRGEPQRVTETAWREQDPRWSPNGKWIAFVADRTGRQEVYISDEPGKNPKKLSDADCDKLSIAWAPDSKSLLWAGSDHTLRRVDIESGKTDVVVKNDSGNIAAPQFSPDGKWLSYSKEDKLLRSHVWVMELATGQERMIASDDFGISRGARWTPDGKKLLLLGGFGAASIASTSGRGSLQLYGVALTHIEKDPANRDINTEAQEEAAAPETPAGAGRGGRGMGANARPVEVAIEWDGIERRITQLTRMAGSVAAVVPSPDSRTYLIVASGAPGSGVALYTMAEDGTRLTRLNTTVPPSAEPGRGGGGRGPGGLAEPQWARDGRGIYFLQGGSIYTLAVNPAPADGASPSPAGRGRGGDAEAAAPSGGPGGMTGAPPRRIDFSVRMEIDVPAERKQVFEETWRVMKTRFYDAKMHGVNWNAARDTFEPLLAHVADSEELHNIIMEMIGELNASHTGVSGGSRLPGEPQTEAVQTRYPGFDLEPDASGFYKISHIYRKGPADRDYIKLAVGDFVLAVNGRDLRANESYWKLFNILPGRKFEFRVNSKPVPEGAWNITVEPLAPAAFADLQYARWVEDRRRMVEKLSGGQIGYLHIRAMDAPSLAKFQIDLLQNQDKKALIIDQRFNGGGGIDQELLAILGQRKPYQTTRGRDSLDVQRPAQAFFGPMVVLQNERSASDAEMFPDGFRALGLGKIVGVPTMGAVIGTGAFTLLDGSALRTPGSGVYTARGENMENYGVQPDILVDNTPADFAAGRDRQIEKAIESLKGQIQ